jgi:hypothetical protein
MRTPSSGGDDLLRLHRRKRLDLVLQPRERLHVFGRDQVRAAREELPELDERRPQALEIGGELLRRPAAFLRVGAPVCRGQVAAEVRDERPAPVLDEQPRDLGVPLEVGRSQR